MKYIKLGLTVSIFSIILWACKKKFLDVTPVGVLDEVTLSTEKGVNKLLIAAYAMLDAHGGDLNLGAE